MRTGTWSRMTWPAGVPALSSTSLRPRGPRQPTPPARPPGRRGGAREVAVLAPEVRDEDAHGLVHQLPEVDAGQGPPPEFGHGACWHTRASSASWAYLRSVIC